MFGVLVEDGPSVTVRTLPVKVGGPTRYVQQQFDFPHLWFTSLSTSRKEMWKGSVEGADGAALVFRWNMKHTDFVRKHPTLKPEGWSDTIPIGQHRDACFSARTTP